MIIPRVSIIIPAYNAGAHIDRTIRSVREQTYPRELIEVVVVNDGSTDRTAEVVDRYAKEYKVIIPPTKA
jgi:glycosyltransferase involved in cell wall biosynthesis